MKLPRGCGLGTVGTALPCVMQELVRPALERGGRRGGVLIAAQAVHHVVWDGGPADELGLERRDRGNGLWCRANPQEARFLVLLDRWIEDLRKERHEVG